MSFSKKASFCFFSHEVKKKNKIIYIGKRKIPDFRIKDEREKTFSFCIVTKLNIPAKFFLPYFVTRN